MKNKILFWQSHLDLLRILSATNTGRVLIIFLNYFIWVFLFSISFLLVSFQINIFWQLLIATIIGEIIEKYGKSHIIWRRPMFDRKDSTPVGLVDSWYKTGSFPSGHTIKATFFFLFLCQYQVISPIVYLIFVLPLLTFRVLMGFHYPIDLIGGVIFGALIWIISHQIVAIPYLNDLALQVFNFIFLIKP